MLHLYVCDVSGNNIHLRFQGTETVSTNAAVTSQQQEGDKSEKMNQIFQPKELLHKSASELPDGVDPTQKEVCLSALLINHRNKSG